MVRWAYSLITGEFLRGGRYEPSVDPETEAVVTLETHPDPATERYDATSPTLKRAATPAERYAYSRARRLAQLTSRTPDPDVVALIHALADELSVDRQTLLRRWQDARRAQADTV